MIRKRQLIVICTAIILILSTFISPPLSTMASEQLGVNFKVTTSSHELTLNSDHVAQGDLNVQVAPYGILTQNEREAIDVAFVYDTSGSMVEPFSESDYKKKGKKKSQIAQEALVSALNYFEDNKKSGDNFYFVPFNDNVRNEQQVKVVQGLNSIKSVADYIARDKYNNGGTNYTQTLEETERLLKNSSNKNKYIIFLTDGEPTVLYNQNKEYILYTNGQAKYNDTVSWYNYRLAKELIHEKALKSSEKLATSGITMYSIGFAQEDEIDFQLLQNMSSKTGGYAERANSDNLTAIFEQMSKRIDSMAISGEVVIDLNKFDDKVTVPTTANIEVDENKKIHVPFHFNFPVGANPDPSKTEVKIPLVFTEEGLYGFDNIKILYNDVSKTHSTFEINVNKDSNSEPGANLTVKPSAQEVIKPPGENAKGNIDITITPKGKAPSTLTNRLPIDVVFVHDTSGSMEDNFPGTGARKDTTAKLALQGALDIFESNENDDFYFIPFDSKVSNKKIEEYKWGWCDYGFFDGPCLEKNTVATVGKTQGLQNIKAIIQYLDSVSSGGTNYNAGLKAALSEFNLIERSNKYIVFLTDGKPTSLVHKGNEYYSDSPNDWKNIDGIRVNLQDFIKNDALNTATLIGNSGVTMYSIGFASKEDVDAGLLQDMSSRTGGYAVQGNTDNLATIFEEIAKKVEMTTISGNVTIDLSGFGGKVIVDTASNFKADDKNKVRIPFKISFPAGLEPNPNLIQQSLPLQFKEAGTYDFTNKIVMNYSDVNGEAQNPVIGDPFQITVKDSTAPKFANEVEILGNQYYSPESLIKVRNTDSVENEFTVKYKLSPETVLTNNTNGKINSIKIIQPLFGGISFASSERIKLFVNGSKVNNGANVSLINEGKDAEISLSNLEITYSKNTGFSAKEITVELKLKADWAIAPTKMPQANITYYDSVFFEQTHSLNVDDQRIAMKVSLPGTETNYYGDYAGLVTKVNNSSGAQEAQTVITNENGAYKKPVKGMELINDGKAILVTYFDGSTAILYLKTDYTLKNLSLKTEIQSGAETIGRVGFKINNLILGEGVIYQYQYENKGDVSEWVQFEPSATIELPQELEGEVEIRVKTIGGFSLNTNPIIKKVTIIKEEIEVDPSPIKLNVGDNLDVKVTLEPKGKVVEPEGISIRDTSVARYENGKVIGIKAGETKLVVETVDITGTVVQAEVPIEVNSVLITGIAVTPNPLNIGKFKDFKDFVINIEPNNASNKDLLWTSLKPSDVVIKGPGWIYGNSTGTAEIEIKATDGSNVSTKIVVNVGNPLTGIDVRDLVTIEKGATDKNVNNYFNYLPSDATNVKGNPSFESTNENILEVEANGEIIPKRVGEAGIEITVQDESDNTYSAELKVKVVEPGSNDKNQGDKY